MSATPEGRRPADVLLPILAIVVSFGSGLLAMLVTPADLLGYDFAAYADAARRIVDGRALYDLSVTETGGFLFYYYPPPFAVLMIPFLALPAGIAPWVWGGILYLAFLAGMLVMPVAWNVRWLTLLTFGLSWPVAYSLKLGQVGPLLVLAFALGWRWLERPIWLGLTIAFGTLVKLQPALLIAWAVVTRRWRAAVVAVVAIAVASLAALPLVGTAAWPDFVAILLRVSQPVTTEHNFAPGAIAYQAGASASVGAAVQAVSTLAALVAMVWAWLRRDAVAGYLCAVLVSQLVSPILWDHYAIVLALPVAYLASRGQWWSLAIPLAMAWPLIGLTPAFVYPLAFWVTLAGVLWVGRAPRATPARTIAEATT